MHQHIELDTVNDTVSVQTPFGRVFVSHGDGPYLVADITPDDGAARVFIDSAEVFDPELGYV
jgi:hypothetical protein